MGCQVEMERQPRSWYAGCWLLLVTIVLGVGALWTQIALSFVGTPGEKHKSQNRLARAVAAAAKAMQC